MSDREPNNDALSRDSLEALMQTPVGRRWVLKAGLTSAVALAARTWGAPVARAASGRAAVAADGAKLVPFQFALGSAPDAEELMLLAGPHRVPLVAHTAASRRALVARGGLWGKVDPGALTHFVEAVELPADRAQLIAVVGRRGGRNTVLAQLWHTPRDAVEALARTAARLDPRGLERVVGSDERVAELGIRARDLASPREVGELAGLVNDQSTAVSIVMVHPNVANLNKDESSITTSLLHGTDAVTTLGTTIGKVLKSGEDVIPERPVLNRDGSHADAVVGGKTFPMMIWGLNNTNEAFVRSAKSAVTAGITAVRSDTRLGAVIDKPLSNDDTAVKEKTWTQPQGVAPKVTTYSPAAATAAAAGRRPLEDAETKLQVKIKDPGSLIGTETRLNGGYEHGSVPLKLHNNFVRWLSVYVQYLGKDNENLSLDNGKPWPNTRHAEFLGLLPQVPTVFGVPLVRSDIAEPNKLEVELHFPEGSHAARLLYCGLGFSLGGQWREYFPEWSYPQGIAPWSEIGLPSALTAILGIGLNAYALVGAFEIAAAWAAINSDIQHFVDIVDWSTTSTKAVSEFFGDQFAQFTAKELIAATVAAGTAKTTELGLNNHEDPAALAVETVWKLVTELGQVLLKLLFSGSGLKLWINIGVKVAGFQAGSALASWLPFVGQAVAVITLLGDAATLGQCVFETLTSPSVIENEVSLTYKATVTVKHDPRNATFPRTARRWRLTPTGDGAVVADVVEGKIQENGNARSQPLEIPVTAPFGGSEIVWSIVFENEDGNQIGTGRSASYRNDDPEHIPDKVEIEIVEIPVPITSKTVFRRVATTAYSEAEKGYTWSDKVKVDAVRESGEIQEVISTSIATRLGVAAVVWKAKDRYYVRGVPVAQDGKTISLGAVPDRDKGYARRPFVLLDSFVEDADQANHWLLEPHETQSVYNIRKLTLDPKTGGMVVDTASHGVFALPVSAAAVHASGRVVAINTNTSRISWLEPTPFVPVGNYTGGVSREGGEADFGLLASPTAITITHTGVVLILEAGGPALAAFDLNANPIQRFGTDTKSASHKLDKDKTYLDISVDGAEQIYLLYHTTPAGGTVRPQDFSVDVLRSDGSLITTGGGGVNVPHIAVDFWRSIYAANYAPLTVLGNPGQLKQDPKFGVDEPSLSRFDPSVSKS